MVVVGERKKTHMCILRAFKEGAEGRGCFMCVCIFVMGRSPVLVGRNKTGHLNT